MAITIAANGNYEQKVIEMGSATATSSDTETALATIDARGFSLGVITAKNAGAQSVTFHVYGYNDPAGADMVVPSGTTPLTYKTTALASGAVIMLFAGVSNNITTPNPLPCAYYRINLINTTTGAGHASSASVYWCLKNT